MPDINMLPLNLSIQASSLRMKQNEKCVLDITYFVAFGLIQIVTIVPKEAMQMLIGLYDTFFSFYIQNCNCIAEIN